MCASIALSAEWQLSCASEEQTGLMLKGHRDREGERNARGGRGGRTKENALGKSAAESRGRRTVPCTRQTSLCTCASANFRGLTATDDDGDVDGVDESGVAACTAVAIVYRTKGKGEEVERKGGPKRLF
jgi:hypothetical protein